MARGSTREYAPVSVRIAALLTFHNRKELTLSCLRQINAQQLPQGVSIDVIAVDDGSSDGTRQAIACSHPSTEVILGDGSLYWGGGMHLAFERALKRGYDFYLWINDDIDMRDDLVADALAFYEDCVASGEECPIVVGVFADPTTQRTVYGGWRTVNRLLPGRLRLVEDRSAPQECDTSNGNFVLIPAAVPEEIGNIDSEMKHVMGDLDYCLRARKVGHRVVTMPGTAGNCRPNLGHLEYAFSTGSIIAAWRYFISVKCLPVRAWGRFHMRHGGPLWPVTFISPYIKFWIYAVARLLTRNTPPSLKSES